MKPMMKKNLIISALSILAIGFGTTSCLDGDQQNTPYNGSPTIVEMSYILPTSANLNSGLQFFAGQTLLLNPGHTADTITFGATVQGQFTEDVNVTISVNKDRVADNKVNDHLDYTLLTEGTQYKLITTPTQTVHPGRTPFVEYQVVFFPQNIDFTKSFILPISVTNDKDLTVSSNFGTVYFHIIGNPIAGLYDWKFTRYDNATGTGPIRADLSWNFGENGDAVFLPDDPTTIETTTGYVGGTYIITFDDDGAGHLTNFKAVIDPDLVNGDWKDQGISITSDPTITVTPDYKSIKIHFQVRNSSGPRDLTDEYEKK
jgi:hypothetical protein